MFNAFVYLDAYEMTTLSTPRVTVAPGKRRTPPLLHADMYVRLASGSRNAPCLPNVSLDYCGSTDSVLVHNVSPVCTIFVLYLIVRA